jgi:DNA polymerase/3'-5' exonuclease PolX
MATKLEISEHLNEIGKLLNDGPENWKAISYFRASKSVRDFEEDLLFEEGKLKAKIENVGKSTKAVIEEFNSTGTSEKFKDLVEGEIDLIE